MKHEPQFDWDEEAKIATCILTYGENVFVGTAQCHPEDYDMCNSKTGLKIAHTRATIKYYVHIRDYEIKPALKALNKLYSEMKYSKKFDEASYEAKSLKKHIYRTKVDLATIQELIENTKNNLNTYISDKESFYKRIRSNRKNDRVGQKS